MTMDQSMPLLEAELESQTHRRNEVIVLDSTSDKCLVTSHLSTPPSDDGTATGVMFSIETAKDFVEIQTIDFYADNTEGKSSVEITVYTRSGIFVGFEEQASAWIQIATTTVTLAAEGRATIIPQQAFQPVKLEPSSRQSFYISLNTTSLRFSETKDASLQIGATYVTDDFLSITSGVSLSDLFVYNQRHQRYPRSFSGALYYSRQLSCTDAKIHTTVEYNYILEAPKAGIVLTPISDTVKENVKTFINTDKTFAQYVSNEMLTLDDVRSQAVLVEDKCPNGWSSCFRVTTDVSVSYMDFPTSGTIVYGLLEQQPNITAGLGQKGLTVEYCGSTPLAYNYTFLLNGVPYGSNMDNVETAYFERVTLQFLQEALQNVTSATVLAVQVNSQASNTGVSSGQRQLRERRIQQSEPPSGVLQIFATIYGVVQLPETLTPLDLALADAFDQKSEDLTYGLTSEIFQPGSINQGGEGDMFAQLFGVRAESGVKQNQTGLSSPSGSSSTSANSSGKILGIPGIWFVVLCIGVIFLMITWLAYIYVQDKREVRQWRRLVAAEQREKKRKSRRNGDGSSVADSEDLDTEEGLLVPDKGYSTDGLTAAESFESVPLNDGSVRNTGQQMRPGKTQLGASDSIRRPSDGVDPMNEEPSGSRSPSPILKDSNRDPMVQGAIPTTPNHTRAAAEEQEQSSVVQSLPQSSPPVSPTVPTESANKSPKSSKNNEQKSPRREKVAKEMSASDASSLQTTTEEADSNPSSSPLATGNAEAKDAETPAENVASTRSSRSSTSKKSKSKKDKTTPQPQPPSRLDEEEPSELEKVRARVMSTPPPAPNASQKKASSKSNPVAVAAAVVLEEFLQVGSPPTSLVKEEPSEFEKTRARIMHTEPLATRTKEVTKSTRKEGLEDVVPKGSISKGKNVFDRKKDDAAPITKPDPPTPSSTTMKDGKDAFTLELLQALQSSTEWRAIRDQLAKLTIPIGREKELLDAILVCCAQEPSYEKRFGKLAVHLVSTLQLRWKRTLEQGFTDAYHNVAQFTLLSNIKSRNTPLRNVAKFFAHLLAAECLPWSVLRILHEEQNSNNDSNKAISAESRVFVKTLVQEVAKAQRKEGESTDDEASKDGTAAMSDEELLLHMDNARAA